MTIICGSYFSRRYVIEKTLPILTYVHFRHFAEDVAQQILYICDVNPYRDGAGLSHIFLYFLHRFPLSFYRI
jgi:hypothetical protein